MVFSQLGFLLLEQDENSLYGSERTETCPDSTQTAMSSLWSGLTNEAIEDFGHSTLSTSDLTHLHGLDKTSLFKSEQVKRDPTKVIYKFFAYASVLLV